MKIFLKSKEKNQIKHQEKNWLPFLEVITYSGPHRRLVRGFFSVKFLKKFLSGLDLNFASMFIPHLLRLQNVYVKTFLNLYFCLFFCVFCVFLCFLFFVFFVLMYFCVFVKIFSNFPDRWGFLRKLHFPSQWPKKVLPSLNRKRTSTTSPNEWIY